MIFAFLFGLSMDYEVFILTRVREEYDRTGDTNMAVTEGLGTHRSPGHERGADPLPCVRIACFGAGHRHKGARYRARCGHPVRRDDREGSSRAGARLAVREVELVVPAKGVARSRGTDTAAPRTRAFAGIGRKRLSTGPGLGLQTPAGRHSRAESERISTVGDDWARPLVHWEIVARDPVRQAVFYRQLFNWEIVDGPIAPITPGIGGPEPGPGGHIRQGDVPAVILYVQVRDLRGSLARTQELGGKVVSDPFDIPNGPTLAAVEDPEGNALVLVQQ